jgi:aminoglycoside 6'-N-acetyltransferase
MTRELVREGDLGIRVMTRADLAQVVAWRAAPHVREFWDNDDEAGGLDPETLRAHYAPLAAEEPPTPTTATIIEIDGAPVGYLQFYSWSSYAESAVAMGISLDGNVYGLDIFIGDSTHVGRGVGSRAVDVVTRWLFETRGASRVAFVTEIGNDRALRAYERAGFTRARRALDTDTRGGARIESWLMVRDAQPPASGASK